MLGKMSVGVRRMTRRGDENQQRENDKRVRSIESKLDNPHTILLRSLLP